MKAAEVLRLYKAGERDFSGESLRGENFKGKDLSGSDFSGADIRSTNFTNANLTGANFTNAKAGLAKSWTIGLVFVSLFLSFFSGFLSPIIGYVFDWILNSQMLEKQGSIVITVFNGVSSLTLLIQKFVEVVVLVALETVAGTVAGFIFLAGFIAGLFALGITGALAAVVEDLPRLRFSMMAIFLTVSMFPRRRQVLKNIPEIRSFAIACASIGGTSFRRTILTDANFAQAWLKSTDFRQAELLRTCWRYAKRLERVRPGATYLSDNKIKKLLVTGNGKDQSFVHLTDLKGLNLQYSNLMMADFSGATLLEGDFQGANLRRANLRGVDLRGVDLSEADLSEADLNEANLSRGNLRGANLSGVQALGTNFKKATFTGACLKDLNINSSTSLKDVVCDYVYLEDDHQERRPHGGCFREGEFTQRFQQTLETVDLFFDDGVDWKAFLTSFQDLQSEYGDDNLAVQGIERKAQSSFEIRLAVPPEADKAEIEKVAYERYEINLKQLEAQYREQLAAKDTDIKRYQQKNESLTDELLATYRQQNSDLTELVKLAASRPINVEATAVAENSNRKTDLRGAQFAGGFAETVQGNQYGGIINNYGPNAEDITRLLTALRDQAQAFPTDQKDEANDALDNLERDLADEQPDQGRIGRRLKKLVALGAAIGTIASGAAAVSGDVSTFIGNVIELTEKLGIPVEQVQLPASGTP